MKFVHEFLHYDNGSVKDNGWWEISEDGAKLFNMWGGWHDYTPREDDIIVEADNWDQLDWSCLLKPDSPYGWIDRRGVWYGCDYQSHAEVAELVLHSSERALEVQGWVKVFRGLGGKADWYIDADQGIRGRITAEQVKALKEHGIHEPWFDRWY